MATAAAAAPSATEQEPVGPWQAEAASAAAAAAAAAVHAAAPVSEVAGVRHRPGATASAAPAAASVSFVGSFFDDPLASMDLACALVNVNAKPVPLEEDKLENE